MDGLVGPFVTRHLHVQPVHLTYALTVSVLTGLPAKPAMILPSTCVGLLYLPTMYQQPCQSLFSFFPSSSDPPALPTHALLTFLSPSSTRRTIPVPFLPTIHTHQAYDGIAWPLFFQLSVLLFLL